MQTKRFMQVSDLPEEVFDNLQAARDLPTIKALATQGMSRFATAAHFVIDMAADALLQKISVVREHGLTHKSMGAPCLKTEEAITRKAVKEKGADDQKPVIDCSAVLDVGRTRIYCENAYEAMALSAALDWLHDNQITFANGAYVTNSDNRLVTGTPSGHRNHKANIFVPVGDKWCIYELQVVHKGFQELTETAKSKYGQGSYGLYASLRPFFDRMAGDQSAAEAAEKRQNALQRIHKNAVRELDFDSQISKANIFQGFQFGKIASDRPVLTDTEIEVGHAQPAMQPA